VVGRRRALHPGSFLPGGQALPGRHLRGRGTSPHPWVLASSESRSLAGTYIEVATLNKILTHGGTTSLEAPGCKAFLLEKRMQISFGVMLERVLAKFHFVVLS
jgi:hypothetical protein